MVIRYRKELDLIEPYIPGKHLDEVKREYGLSDIIKLASNENPLGMSSLAREAIIANLENVHLYPDGNATALRSKLAEHLSVSTEQIIVGNGSDEIIKMIAEGLTNAQIAEDLFLSNHTINTHRKNILSKLGIKNTAGIVMYAVKMNLVSPNKFLFAGD